MEMVVELGKLGRTVGLVCVAVYVVVHFVYMFYSYLYFR